MTVKFSKSLNGFLKVQKTFKDTKKYRYKS